MCRVYRVHYEDCGHMEDELLYLCPEASRLCRPCEHPVRLSSPRAREKLCLECRPPTETWPLMGRTAIGYLVLNFPYVLLLLVCGPFFGIYFIMQKTFGLFQTLYKFFHSALHWFSEMMQTIVAALLLYTSRIAALTKMTVFAYLWLPIKSSLWWSVAIAMTPFFAILAILEALEDNLWPHLPKIFWEIVDFSTGEVFRFYAMYFLFLSYFVAPVSSVTKWLETITKIFAPFQVARLYIWYRDEAWNRLGDFWAVFALNAVSTSILTSLIMAEPQLSVLSFLNRWVYAIVFILSVAEPIWTFLGALYYDIKTALPQVRRQEMVQKGFGRAGQEVLQNRLAQIWQVAHFRTRTEPTHNVGVVQTSIADRPLGRLASAYRDTAVQASSEDILQSRAAGAHRDSEIQAGDMDPPPIRKAPMRQGSVVQTDRAGLGYAGKPAIRWRRGSYERVRPT
jgi:hypothetical protein